MKISTLVFYVAVACACPVFAEEKVVIPEFSAVDKDMDGILSITEAKLTFPSLTIMDVVMDGLLSKKEAELALPGLVYGDDNHEDDTKLVGADEYLLMAEQYLLAAQEAMASYLPML